MKAKFFWTYIIVLVFSPFVIASPDGDDMEYTDNKVLEVRNFLVGIHNDLVLVVEAKSKSGSLITVDFALEQGKTVLKRTSRRMLPYGLQSRLLWLYAAFSVLRFGRGNLSRLQ